MDRQLWDDKTSELLRLYAFQKRTQADKYISKAIGVCLFALGIACGLVIAGIIYGRTI